MTEELVRAFTLSGVEADDCNQTTPEPTYIIS